MIIGITGGTGCGKTTLLKLIAELGGTVLDCDAIYHELLKADASLLQAIEKRFPGTVTDGTLDRKKLGSIVFSDESALLDLNRITHKAVKDEVLGRLSEKPALAAIDAIGLFEGELAQLCDVTVAVTLNGECLDFACAGIFEIEVVRCCLASYKETAVTCCFKCINFFVT